MFLPSFFFVSVVSRLMAGEPFFFPDDAGASTTTLNKFDDLILQKAREPTYNPIEWPRPDLEAEWTNECTKWEAFVYFEDFGWDALVGVLPAGHRATFKHTLGNRFFVTSGPPDHLTLGGPFIMHWDWERPAAVDSGSSRRFVVRCPQDGSVDWAAGLAAPAVTFASDTGDTRSDPGSAPEPRIGTRRLPRPFDESDSLWRARRWNENVRMRMSRGQPSEVDQFTEKGYVTGLRMEDLSPTGWEQLKVFYQANKDTQAEIVEKWGRENTYVNHWQVPTTVVHVPYAIKEILWNDFVPHFSNWTGVQADQLIGSSVYGIRRYWKGSFLQSHVDRGDQLVISAIIHVDRGEGEDWPLLIYDSKFNPNFVMMKPGDVVFYESACRIHGRPFPLNSTYYANIFLHTKPKTWPYPGFKG